MAPQQNLTAMSGLIYKLLLNSSMSLSCLTASRDLSSDLLSRTVWVCRLDIKLSGTFPVSEPEVRALCATLTLALEVGSS